MTGFWAPYDSFEEARAKLCRFADAVGGPALGVTLSDGRAICALRKGVPSQGRTLWLNVLTRHVAAPAPTPPAAASKTGGLKAWFWRAMELEGAAEIQNAQAQMAASQAVATGIHDHVWEPAQEFLHRHKLLADTAGVALDVVGVAAAAVFVFVAAPELLAAAVAGSVAAGVGLLTGSAATVGATVLFGIDGFVYGAEVSGHNAFAKKIEDNPTIGWIRVGATVMLLPDLPVGGVRALKEIGATTAEAGEALGKTVKAQRSISNAQRDLRNVTNPSRHPAEVARQLARVDTYASEATVQMKKVEAANARVRILLARDMALFPGATVGGAALMAANPPDVGLNRTPQTNSQIMPAKGWPKDVRMDMRIMGYSSAARP